MAILLVSRTPTCFPNLLKKENRIDRPPSMALAAALVGELHHRQEYADQRDEKSHHHLDDPVQGQDPCMGQSSYPKLRFNEETNKNTRICPGVSESELTESLNRTW